MNSRRVLFGFCVFAIMLQCALPPQVAVASSGVPAVGVSPLEGDVGSSGPKRTSETPRPPATPDVFQKFADSFFAPDKQDLASLVGASQIDVLANVNTLYVRGLEDVSLFKERISTKAEYGNLSGSIRAGRNFSRESHAALARQEQAKAQTGQALSLLLPSISVRAASGYETSKPAVIVDEATGDLIASDTHSRTDLALTVRQPLFDLPSFLDWRRRKVVEQARGESYRVSDSDAYISTVNAYLSLVSSRLQADITRDFQLQLAELLSYIEKRASAGAASVSDMERVRARIEETLSSRLEQESANATAGLEFIRLTNLAPKKVALPRSEDVGASLVPDSFDAAVVTAMDNNPEIASLGAELLAAKIDQSAAKGRYLPRLDAEYTDTYARGAGGDTSSQRDQRYMMVLNWSLFNGGGDYKYYVERTERYKELQYRLDVQRRRIVQELSANYTALATTRGRISSGYLELKSIATAAEAMSKRMLSGNQSLLDLLDVYDRFFQVRSRLVSLHALEMSTTAQLVRLAFGTPWATTEGSAPVKGEFTPATL